MSELRELYQQAFDAFASQSYDSAITLYQSAIKVDGAFSLAHQGLAECYSRLGRLDDAIASIQEAIRLEPEESLFHTSLSRFLQMQGKIPEAETAAAVAGRLQSKGP